MFCKLVDQLDGVSPKKLPMKKPGKLLILVCLIQLFVWVQAGSQSTYTNFDDFKDAIAAAQPGDEIILAAGRYKAESLTMEDVAGTEAKPVIIRAEHIGADTLDAGTYFDLRHCSHVIIQGFVINITEKSTTFKIQTCNNIRITQNVLDGSGEAYLNDDGDGRNSSVWISIQSLWDDPTGLSHHNRIDHNLFQNKQTLGNMIRIDGTNELYVSQYDIIEYNHLKNMGPRADNEMEAIRIGWSAMSESEGYTTVSNNLFEECNGDPEIISVKCNKNTISHNTFRRCKGTLSLRHGNESLVEGNFFLGEGAEGTGGVRLYGSDHRIINNYFEGLTGTKWDAPITLTHGDAEEGSSGLTKHFRIERAVIANNTLVNNEHGIEIGYDNQAKYSKPPRDVILAYNLITSDTGTLVTYINPPTNMIWINNLLYPEGNAILRNGLTFSAGEIVEADPLLEVTGDYTLYKASTSTPDYTPDSEAVGAIERDMDGQMRSSSTHYGSDEYSTDAVAFHPLFPSEVGPDMGEYMNVSENEITFLVAGGEEIVEISSNLHWEISSDLHWLTVDPATGSVDGSITITVAENSTGLLRSGTLSIESTNASGDSQIIRAILVNQLKQDGSIGSEVKLRIIDAVATTEQTSEGNIADNVYDGILSNRWSGDGDGAHITLDLGGVQKISFLKVGLYKGDSRSSYFDTKSSLNGNDYFEVLTGVSSELTEEPLVIYDFADTTARYVRITGHGNSSNTWNSYTEFEVWGWILDSKVSAKPLSTQDIRVYPNPSNGIFTIAGHGDSHLSIYSITGQILFRKELRLDNEVINCGLPSGTYILSFKKGYPEQRSVIIINKEE